MSPRCGSATDPSFDFQVQAVQTLIANLMQDIIFEDTLRIVGPVAVDQKGNSVESTADTLMQPRCLYKHRAKLARDSRFGFVGLQADSSDHNERQVALNSCLGMWAGCIPTDAPALVYHHGAAVFDDEYLKQFRGPIVAALELWTSMLTERKSE